MRQWQQFDNIATILPKIKVCHTGKYIEMNLSKINTLKAKQELQPDHFAGSQYALHCSIILPVNN